MVSPGGCSVLRHNEPSNLDRKKCTSDAPDHKFSRDGAGAGAPRCQIPPGLLGEAMQMLLDGDLEEGRSALRSCINATIGFEKLGTALGISPKSLMRMFGPSGNPTAENLLAVIGLLQQETGVRLHVRAAADAA
jgi:DNA-binding phage protein